MIIEFISLLVFVNIVATAAAILVCTIFQLKLVEVNIGLGPRLCTVYLYDVAIMVRLLQFGFGVLPADTSDIEGVAPVRGCFNYLSHRVRALLTTVVPLGGHLAASWALGRSPLDLFFYVLDSHVSCLTAPYSLGEPYVSLALEQFQLNSRFTNLAWITVFYCGTNLIPVPLSLWTLVSNRPLPDNIQKLLLLLLLVVAYVVFAVWCVGFAAKLTS